MSNAPAAPTRMSKSALFSLIFGILGCIPVAGVIAFLLGIVGFFAAGKPGMRGRWMAIVGAILGLIFTAIYIAILVGGLAVVGLGKSAYNAITAPGHATRDFIQAVDKGDDAAAKDLSVMSDADFLAAKALIKAQGGFVDSTFNNNSIDNNTGHASGTVTFKTGTRQVSADLVEVGTNWKVKSLEITP